MPVLKKKKSNPENNKIVDKLKKSMAEEPVRITVYVPAELRDEIKLYCFKNKVSGSEMTRRLWTSFLEGKNDPT